MSTGKIIYSHKGLLTVYSVGSEQAETFGGVPLMGAPAWHPDGEQVVFGVQTVYVLHTATSEVVALTPPDFKASYPAWHPRGDYVVFSVQAHPTLPDGLVVYDLETRALNPIPLAFYAFQGAWRPDGEVLVFVGLVDGEKQIFTLDMGLLPLEDATPHVRQLTPSGIRFNHAPSWSPDGAMIVFERFLPDQNRWSIMRMRADGQDLQPIGDPQLNAYHPTWSPSGDQIAFAGEGIEGGASMIYVMDADGNGVEPLIPHAGSEPDWK